MDKEKFDARLRKAADRVVQPLEKLVSEMAGLEPGAAVTDAQFMETESGVRVAYKARPVSVAFVNSSRRITVRVEPLEPPQDV